MKHDYIFWTAARRLQERKVSKARIVKTVESPQQIFKSFKGRKLRQRKFGNKVLEVVTITEGAKIIIISLYYLENRRKYEN